MYKKHFIILALAVIVLCVLPSCHKKHGIKHARSFYYWKTRISIDSTESKSMNEFAVKHLYIRYFDVQWSAALKKAIPVGTSDGSYPFNFKLDNYTPCVFILNSVFEQATDADLDELAQKIVNKMETIDKDLQRTMVYGIVENEVKYNYHRRSNWDSIDKLRTKVEEREKKRIELAKTEIQIDCDWTAKTSQRYFAFLKHIKTLIGKKELSCTLRIWQYKNRELAGIPPVDRCLLMCYSMANPKKIDIENSIASFDMIKAYLKVKSYPLKLDVALPLYSWAILFRNSEFKGILGAADEKSYIANTSFYTPKGKHRYEVKRDTVVADTYLRYGDEIRVEQVSGDELIKIADLLAERLDLDKTSRISLFSWDTIYIKQYDKEKIKKVYSLFD